MPAIVAARVLRSELGFTRPLTSSMTLIAAAVCSFGLAYSTPSQAQGGAPDCDDLSWSARVLAANPDMPAACRGVYERYGELYAKVTIELTRVRGSRLTFRPLHVDGSKGAPRSITVKNSWRASIEGREYRASDLKPGQILNVYIPEDRFALAAHDGDFDADEDLVDIEDASVVVMPPKPDRK